MYANFIFILWTNVCIHLFPPLRQVIIEHQEPSKNAHGECERRPERGRTGAQPWSEKKKLQVTVK